MRNLLTGNRGGNRGNVVKAGRPPLKPYVADALKSLRLNYEGLTYSVVFDHLLFWEDTGEWAAMYITHVCYAHRPGDAWTERYVWTYRNGDFKELKQMGVRNSSGFRRLDLR